MDTTSVKVSQQITDSTAVRLRFPYDLRLVLLFVYSSA